MDSWRVQDLSNPASEAFRREAARNVQQNISAMKTQKELKDGQADASDELKDRVTLQKAAAPLAKGGDTFDKTVEAARGQGLLEDQDPTVKRRKQKEAKRKAQDGVPAEILKASRHIVEGQLHPTRGPRDALKEIKTSPETAEMRMEPADFMPALPIHDEANHPLMAEDDEGGG
ncbi:MAG: hypothetical protein FJX76_17460 [Armatimonadetes bacterium]|nr:hypothetical protein [Armatimonadota bacterium]